MSHKVGNDYIYGSGKRSLYERFNAKYIWTSYGYGVIVIAKIDLEGKFANTLY